MKTKSILLGLLLCAGLFTATFTPKLAADNPKRDRAFAVIGYATTNLSVQLPNGNGNTAIPQGLIVTYVELSTGCPHVARGDRVADHMVTYLEQGFTILFVDGSRVIFVR